MRGNSLLIAVVAVMAAMPASGSDMANIPAGEYRPLYRISSDAPEKTAVGAFYLDRRQVTNGEFLTFVLAHEKWQRSSVKRLFADENYLSHWQDNTYPGNSAPENAIAVNVSWFAADAYCKSHYKRLPTVAEWEYTARAGEQSPDAADEPEFRRRILEWYGRPLSETASLNAGFRNYYGVDDMHGIVWEWTHDFNTALVTGESRADAGLERGLFCGSASIGAADFSDYTAFMRFAMRGSLQGDYTISSLGFRCACDEYSACNAQ